MSLMMGGDAGISAFPDGDNIFQWTGTITGGAGTVRHLPRASADLAGLDPRTSAQLPARRSMRGSRLSCRSNSRPATRTRLRRSRSTRPAVSTRTSINMATSAWTFSRYGGTPQRRGRAHLPRRVCSSRCSCPDAACRRNGLLCTTCAPSCSRSSRCWEVPLSPARARLRGHKQPSWWRLCSQARLPFLLCRRSQPRQPAERACCDTLEQPARV